MTVDSIVILVGYIALHIFSVIATETCLASHTRKDGPYRKIRPVWMALYIFISVLPILGTFWPESALKYSIMKYGNLLIGFDIYYCGFLLIFWAVDRVIRIIRHKKEWKDFAPARWTMIVAIVLALIIPCYAMVHAQRPVVTYWTADLTKGQQEKGTYRVVLLADFHMSVNSKPALIEKAAALANAQDADAIFITGDFFTSNYEGLKDPELYIAALSQLSAREGVFAVYGNHDVKEDLFCGFAVAPVYKAFRPPEMEKFLEDCGFTMLEDETVEIADGNIVLVGRKDADRVGDGTNIRKSAEELLSGIDPDRTVFVLEHEPEEYSTLVAAGADVAFSGHTHRGQIWPCNIFIHFMTENAYGHKTFDTLETFVTSGVGYFGPPQRSGTDSEVMVIDITY